MPAHDDILAAQAAAGVLHHRKGFGQNLVELGREFGLVLDLRKLRLPVGGLLAQVVVGQLLQAGLDLVDAGNERAKLFDFAVVL